MKTAREEEEKKDIATDAQGMLQQFRALNDDERDTLVEEMMKIDNQGF